MIELNKIQILVISVIVLAFLGLTAYIIYDNASDEINLIKSENLEDENSQLRLELSSLKIERDKTISDLETNLVKAQEKPITNIVKYEDKIIYVSVSSDTIIRSFSREAERYRAKKQR